MSKPNHLALVRKERMSSETEPMWNMCAYETRHDKTNKVSGAQRRLSSAWASAQSDQSLRCLHEESLGP